VELARHLRLGNHLKTGHTLSLQNRPTELSQEQEYLYLVMGAVANVLFISADESCVD
jgi:hypothetical protein